VILGFLQEFAHFGNACPGPEKQAELPRVDAR
jgi:hypothetical protein